MNRKIIGIAGIVLVAALTWAAMAYGNGGNSIANAPDLPVGTQTASGWAKQRIGDYSGELWRINLRVGDQLTIDYGKTSSACSDRVYLHMLSPQVTDYTFSSANFVASDETGDNDKAEFVWVAPSAGRWTLLFDGCSTESYEFTAYVRVFTSVSLAAPRVLAAHHVLRIKGSVKTVTKGKISVVVSTKNWKRSKVVAVSNTGSFSWATKIGRSGKYRVSTHYYGDTGHRSSSKVVTVNVV